MRKHISDCLLKRMKATEAVPRLQDFVIGGDKDDRSSAAYALGGIGDPVAIPSLLLALENEPDDDALAAHCWALGEFGEPQALPRLEQLHSHKDSKVKRSSQAATAAIRLGANRKRHDAGEAAGLSTAIEGLKSPEKSIVISAIEYVRRHHADRQAEILGDLCANPRDDIRKAAVQALVTDDSPAATEGLARALSFQDSGNRAISALAGRRDAGAWPVLLKMTQDDNAYNQRFAAENLHYFGDSALPILRDLLADDDDGLRRATLSSLHKIADESVLDALLAYAAVETKDNAKQQIIETLGRIDDPQTIQHLETYLDDPRQAYAWAAVRALVRLGWKPRTHEQRVRYLVVSGQRSNEAVPQTQGDSQTQTGEFAMNVPIQTSLKGGTTEYPALYGVGSIEFRNDADNLTAIAKGHGVSWPKLAFRLTVRLLSKGDQIIARQTTDVSTSGLIISVPMRQADHVEFDFGGVGPDAVQRFEISFSTITDPLPPGVTVSPHSDRDFVLDEDSSLQLSVSHGESDIVLSCDAVKLSEGEPDGNKRRVINAELPILNIGGMNADWRVWIVTFSEDDQATGRGSTEISTILKRHDNPQPQKVNVPIAVWDKDKPVKYIRVGLGLNAAHAGVDGNRVTETVDHEIPKSATAIQLDDGTAESKRSIAASGHAVRFRKPPEQKFLEAVQIFSARYGTPQPPKADFYVYVLDKKQQTVADLTFPYSAIACGEMQWHTLRTPSVELPNEFYIVAAFNPHQTKGLYLGLDDSPDATASFTGLPGDGFTALSESQNWMVRPFLSATATEDLGTHLLKGRPVVTSADPFVGCIEAVSFVGSPQDKQSYGGAGPAIDIDVAAILPDDVAPASVKLKGIRLYASRYGSGYDPKTTTLNLLIAGPNTATLWSHPFPYQHFGYKVKWVDLVIPDPPLIAKHLVDGKLTLGLDPQSHQRQGVYFHYHKVAEGESGMRGLVPGKRFFKVDDRRWAVQVFLTK